MKRLCTLSLLILTGCATPVVSGCVPLQEWPIADQRELAKELSAVSDDKLLWAMEADWVRMRAASRACTTALR